jgi:hypothetical protein
MMRNAGRRRVARRCVHGSDKPTTERTEPTEQEKIPLGRPRRLEVGRLTLALVLVVPKRVCYAEGQC